MWYTLFLYRRAHWCGILVFTNQKSFSGRRWCGSWHSRWDSGWRPAGWSGGWWGVWGFVLWWAHWIYGARVQSWQSRAVINKKKKKYFNKRKKLEIFILLKSFHPPALNASCFLLEHQWMFEPFLIVLIVWVHQLSSVWKDGSQNHTVTAGKGSNMQKCWKTAESTERGGFVWRTVLSSTVQNKQGTHEQPTQNKRTVVDHPGNLTQY